MIDARRCAVLVQLPLYSECRKPHDRAEQSRVRVFTPLVSRPCHQPGTIRIVDQNAHGACFSRGRSYESRGPLYSTDTEQRMFSK